MIYNCFQNIDFKSGVITYDDFMIDLKLPLENQVDCLKEDLFQVDYFGRYIIDVGWYPEFNAKGNFTICLIKDCNWSDPILIKKCRDLNQLGEYMKEFIEYVIK